MVVVLVLVVMIVVLGLVVLFPLVIWLDLPAPTRGQICSLMVLRPNQICEVRAQVRPQIRSLLMMGVRSRLGPLQRSSLPRQA